MTKTSFSKGDIVRWGHNNTHGRFGVVTGFMRDRPDEVSVSLKLTSHSFIDFISKGFSQSRPLPISELDVICRAKLNWVTPDDKVVSFPHAKPPHISEPFHVKRESDKILGFHKKTPLGTFKIERDSIFLPSQGNVSFAIGDRVYVRTGLLRNSMGVVVRINARDGQVIVELCHNDETKYLVFSVGELNPYTVEAKTLTTQFLDEDVEFELGTVRPITSIHEE